MKHGTTDHCAAACTTLIASKHGAQRHDFVMHCARFEKEDHAYGSGESAYKRAWAEVYTKSDFNAKQACDRLGKGSKKGRHGKPAGPVAVANDKLAAECFRIHQAPASQVIAEAMVRAEEDLLEVVQRHVRLDITDFYHNAADAEPDSPSLKKLIRVILRGVERTGSKAVEGHDLCDTGYLRDYDAGFGPPSTEVVVNICRRVGPWAPLSPDELRARGISGCISGYHQDRYGGKFLFDKKAFSQLEAAMTNRLSSTLSIQDGDAAVAEVEIAYLKIQQLRYPRDEANSNIMAAAWELGQTVPLNPGDHPTTKQPDQQLTWDGERWVAVSTLRLAETG